MPMKPLKDVGRNAGANVTKHRKWRNSATFYLTMVTPTGIEPVLQP